MSLPTSQSAEIQSVIVRNPQHKEAHGSGSSDGSTTVSIPSSPSTTDDQEDHEILPHPINVPQKQGPSVIRPHLQPQKSSSSNDHPDEIASRKKPRKQQSPVKKFKAPQATGSKGSKAPARSDCKKNKNSKRVRARLINQSAVPNGWDAPKNHFGCYMDVKPCNVSHTNIMDLVKEPDILERFNGFRIHKVKSQLEDGSKLESEEYADLSTKLQRLEQHSPRSEVNVAIDLMKGNMQRTQLVIDGMNNASTTIKMIFDHTADVTGIILRNADKRSFQCRPKT